MLAAEALVPARAFQGDSAMRQRLMARLENMPGSSTAAAGLAHAQPGSSGGSHACSGHCSTFDVANALCLYP